MYSSPVPLIVIRPAAHSLISVNGELMGECLPGSHLALPAGGAGDYFITAAPLCPRSPAWPVTRKITLEDGAALPPQAEDVTLTAWPGGVYEVALPTPASPGPAHMSAPEELDALSFPSGDHLCSLTLYRENGLRLLCEDGGRAVVLDLGPGGHGSLALYTAGRQFIAVSIFSPGQQRLLMLNTDYEAALEVAAAEITLAEEGVYATEPLRTAMGHQRRTLYRPAAGGFGPGEAEVGFFTNKYAFPGPDKLALAFCEAVREGFEAEAMSYLSPELRRERTFGDIKNFLGNYHDCRPPLSDRGGRLMGLISRSAERLLSARLFEFRIRDGLIDDIMEA